MMQYCPAATVLSLFWTLATVGAAGWSNAPITAATFSPDGKSLLLASQAGIQELAWPDMKPLRQIAPFMEQIHDLVFSPLGQQVAVVGGSPTLGGEVALLDWPQLSVSQQFMRHADVIYALAWSEDSHRIYTASGDHSLRSWSVADGTAGNVRAEHARPIVALIPIPSTTLLATGSLDHTIALVDTRQTTPVRRLEQHTGAICAVAARLRGEGLPLIASASTDRTVRIWQPTIGRMMRFARLPAIPRSLAWSQDGSVIAAGCDDGCVRIIEPHAARVSRVIPAFEGWVHQLLTAPEKSTVFVAAGTGGNVVRIQYNPAMDHTDAAMD